MYEATCTYRSTPSGSIFLPDDIESDECAELRVSFDPLAYYPTEPDVGAGAHFDVAIGAVELMEHRGTEQWRTLTGASRTAAIAFLEQHHHKAMWWQADEEAAEAFGAPFYGRAA